MGYLADSAYRYPTSVVGLHGTIFKKFPISDWYNHHGEKEIFYCYNGLDTTKSVHCLGTGVMAFRVDLLKGHDVYKELKKYKRACDPKFMQICRKNQIASVCLLRSNGFVKEIREAQDSSIWKGLVGKKNVKQTKAVNALTTNQMRLRKPYHFEDHKLTPANMTWGHIKWVAEHINKDSKVVEFGSGRSTPYWRRLTENLTSYEHDKRYKTELTELRPILVNWYSLSVSDLFTCREADIMIIDGPPAEPNGLRYNFDFECLPEKGIIFVDDLSQGG